MRGFPLELVFFALIVGTVLLVRFLYKQLRRKAASVKAEAEIPAASLPLRVAIKQAATAQPDAAAPRARSAQVLPLARTRARRFSRAALMPDRRAVQAAVVIAAILQPCHAHRPHNVD
jgi:hypothetical protein